MKDMMERMQAQLQAIYCFSKNKVTSQVTREPTASESFPKMGKRHFGSSSMHRSSLHENLKDPVSYGSGETHRAHP
jgi:hypothetical protein